MTSPASDTGNSRLLQKYQNEKCGMGDSKSGALVLCLSIAPKLLRKMSNLALTKEH